MPLLQIKNLTHFFGGLRAVYDYNLDLETGELVGLIGPNGAGKTTIFNLVTGAYRPSEGEVRLNGDDMVGLRPLGLFKWVVIPLLLVVMMLRRPTGILGNKELTDVFPRLRAIFGSEEESYALASD